MSLIRTLLLFSFSLVLLGCNCAFASSSSDDQKIREVLAIFETQFSDVQFIYSADSEEVNAQAIQFFGDKAVMVMAGLNHIEGITTDDLALVLCHELGHHFAGAPYLPSMSGERWASAEGMADFWAMKQCFPKIFKFLPQVSRPASASTTRFCSLQSSRLNETFCIRSTEASLFIAQLSAKTSKNHSAPSIEKLGAPKVTETLTDYPTPQCRLDTFISGMVGRNLPPPCWYVP
ncbi:M48 family metalloprotease [Bdellovibrio reynosensis]|uniref:M48 family metalloprotease n=1 Tax=Bdellovibrio reynosensis TaxID=2835041 RepID=A0ABY4C8U3_9BACT|nr:M48 family metalloprotease [Bdellovibrio reynosensis]UOF01355.1 M48 family metalloprotease [Bdellovibrio reynosensis]